MNQAEKIERMQQIFDRCIGRLGFIALAAYRGNGWVEAIYGIEQEYFLLKANVLARQCDLVDAETRLEHIALHATLGIVISKDPAVIHDIAGLIEAVRAEFDACVALAKAKGHDYAGDNSALSNLADFGWRGVVVRLSDKYHRLHNFLVQGCLKVKGESILDTLQDTANYAALTILVMQGTDVQWGPL